MKFASDRPYADPEKAALRIVEIASSIEPVQDGRIHVERVNGPFLFRDRGSAPRFVVKPDRKTAALDGGTR